LNDSIFAATFLDLRNYKSGNLDIYQQFNNIHNQFRDKIQYVTNETIKVSKVHTGNGDFKSSLYMYVFSFANYESEFLYFLAERQHIDTALNKKFVRTCALQLCSNDAYEDLLKSENNYKEGSNIFAYYICKCILYLNYNLFMDWCYVNNSHFFNFTHTSENINSFYEFIRKHYKSKQLFDLLNEMNVELSKISRLSGSQNRFIRENLRLTCVEI
jgi:hypothetical protein